MKKATKKAPQAKAASVEEPVVVESAQESVVIPATPADESDDDDAFYEESRPDVAAVVPPVQDGGNLTVRLSGSLFQKLKRSAQDEGISIEAFATELLSEGVVLRAWEIIQRNSAMRGPTPSQGPSQGQGYRGNNQGAGNQPRHNGGGGGGNYAGGNPNRPGPRNNAWMEDKAAFLEYVRNQEKRRR